MPTLSTLAKIKLHFACVPRGQMVSSRDILIHGERSAVDSAVYILVKENIIWRIARGVFIRAGGRWPSEEEIAAFKAKAFDRQLRPTEGGSATFYIDAGSTSFGHRHGRIYFRGVSKKRVHMEDSPAAFALRTLWQRGKKMLQMRDITAPEMPWNESVQAANEVLISKAWMPSWLGDCFQTAEYLGPPPLSDALT